MKTHIQTLTANTTRGYTAPTIIVTEIAVEQGFAVTTSDMNDIEFEGGLE